MEWTRGTCSAAGDALLTQEQLRDRDAWDAERLFYRPSTDPVEVKRVSHQCEYCGGKHYGNKCNNCGAG